MISKPSSRAFGFTLVELLVVIGIIALLVSILLPTLNSARLSANSVACQSNLRQVGVGIQLYQQDNGGFAPYGEVFPAGTAPGENDGLDPSAANSEGWTWVDTISLLLSEDVADFADSTNGWNNQVVVAAPVFSDTDTLPSEPAPWATETYESHYSANPRFMPTITNAEIDPVTGEKFKPHTWRVVEASEVAIVWDGAQLLTTDSWAEGSAPAVSLAADGGRRTWSHGFTYPNPAESWFNEDYYFRPAFLNATNSPLATQTDSAIPFYDARDIAGQNFDATSDPWAEAGIRHRHMDNTSGNFLFADGHVEAIKVGQLLRRTLCMNP